MCIRDRTWVAWGSGRVPVGINTGDGNFNTVEKTGGESSHKLTVAEMPSHTHSASTGTAGNHDHGMTVVKGYDFTVPVGQGSGSGYTGNGQPESHWFTDAVRTTFAGSHTHTVTVNSTGGNGAHNNLQPYITCYMWKRTA